MNSRPRFEVVKCNIEKRGTCAVCNKRGMRSKTFSQTLNPWNKGADGLQKGRAAIMAENEQRALEWSTSPFVHAKCEDNKND